MWFVFWGSLALVAYAYAGYPLLVWAWGRLAPRPVRRAPCADARIAVIVVAHNEESRIRAKIETLLAQDHPAPRLDIVIATDGSTDGTPDIVRAYADRGVRLLAFPQRRGKAACLNDAVAACDADLIVFNDARQMLNREAVRHLAENFADPSVGAVSGELVFVDDPAHPSTSFAGGVDAYWRYEKFIRQQEAKTHSVPGATGALYAIRRSAYRPIPAGTILDDVAIPMQVVMQGLRTVFDGRAQAYDRPAQEPAQERLRKVRTLAGNYQLLAQQPKLLSPFANPIFVQFFSHKVARLAAPFAMLALLMVSVALTPSSPLAAACLVAQLAMLALAALPIVVPAAGRLRVARLASAFLLLNWFAVLGLVQFLSNRDGHLWAPSGAAAAPGRRRGA